MRKIFLPQSILWVILVQALLKGGGALKFFLVARYVGPSGMGVLGIVLLLVSVTDLLTETGIYQAMIQKPGVVSSEEKSVIFLFQIIRSLMLTLVLATVGVIGYFFYENEVGPIIICYSFLPFIRSLLNLRYQWSIRDRDFKYLAIVDGTWIVAELLLVVLMMNVGYGVMGVGMAALGAELLRISISWIGNPVLVKMTWRYSLLQEYFAYGKWIWKANILTIVLNNFDKLIVIKLLGVDVFGLYQVSSKIAQIFLVEWIQAFSGFLFSSFSSKNRSSLQQAKIFLYKILSTLVPVILLLVVFCWVFMDHLVDLILGKEWGGVTKYALIFLFPMGVGGVIALLVPFLRGVGSPSVVTKATYFQLIALAFMTTIAGYIGSLSFLIFSLGLAGIVALMTMLLSFRYIGEVGDE